MNQRREKSQEPVAAIAHIFVSIALNTTTITSDAIACMFHRSVLSQKIFSVNIKNNKTKAL